MEGLENWVYRPEKGRFRYLSHMHKSLIKCIAAGQKYCRMLQGEHSAILSTFIKLPFVIKFFVLSIFEWPFCNTFDLN